MVYISNGQVLDSRNQSPWRLSFITDFFWGIAEFVVFFFKTLLQQDVKKGRGYGSSSDSRYDDGRGAARKPTTPNGSDQSPSRPQPSSNGWWMRKVNVCSEKQTTRHTPVEEVEESHQEVKSGSGGRRWCMSKQGLLCVLTDE
ncbi:Selenoprotein K [Apodemus speciosus]|uniref:Selenoprotein K n=1 Tax=Apodemus speciosus TaxID=105296 RepID=A0ABQ0FHG2_APOSI